MSHLTMAISEDVINDSLSVLLDERVTGFQHDDEADLGPFSAGIDVAGHFELDAIDFRDSPDRVKIDELDVIWDRLRFWLDVDIPDLCIGGFCVVPTPFGCAVRAPERCLFRGDDDVHIPLNLGGILRSEISGLLAPTVQYQSNRGSRDYLEAQVEQQRRREDPEEDEPVVNTWDVSFYPDTLDIDLLDRADIIADLLEDAISVVIDGLLGGLPDWARDVLRSIFGSLVDIVRTVLDIPDDVGEWFSDLIGVSLDLEGFLITLLDQFFIDYPAYRIEDPRPVLEWEPPLSESADGDRTIPVKIPLAEPSVDVGDTELVITADIDS